MKKIIILSIGLLSFSCFSQKNNLEKLTELYKQQAKTEQSINKLLERDPQLNEFLNTYKSLKINEGKKSKDGPEIEFSERYFEFEAEKIKAILSEDNFDRIRKLFYSVQDSQYAQDISYLVLRQMEIAKKDLEEGIRAIPKPKY
jgi:cell division protein FtsB